MSLIQTLYRFISRHAKNEVCFPWHYVDFPGGKRLFRPLVSVKLQTVDEGWFPFDFIADTGADNSMLPSFMLGILGIRKKDAEKTVATGIGGAQVVTWNTTIPVKIKEWEYTIPVSFTADNDTPFLLGRAKTLDGNFSWIFDHKKKEIVFRR